MRLLVCGSRTFGLAIGDKAVEQAHSERVQLRAVLAHLEPDVLIHGNAPGADFFALRWAREQGVTAVAFVAEWARLGRRAGPERNKRMLRDGRPDMARAFIDKPLKESRGTYDMVRRLLATRTPVVIVEAEVVSLTSAR